MFHLQQQALLNRTFVRQIVLTNATRLHAHNCNAKAHKTPTSDNTTRIDVMMTLTHALHTSNSARNSARVRYESARSCSTATHV